MKLSTKLLSLVLVLGPAVPAPAMAAAPAPVVVARYTFDRGVSPAGMVAENSGRGLPLRVRAADGGSVRVLAGKAADRYVGFPARCTTATTCRRAILQGADDPDLDPGTGQFRYGATVLIHRSQVTDSSNVLQKGVVSTQSQWKMQIGATHGKAQCVVVGRGSSRAYIVRSSVSVADGRWHRVMCMRTPTGLYVFVDGVNRGRVSVPVRLSISNDLPLRLGGPNLGIGSDSYNGYLDDVFVVRG